MIGRDKEKQPTPPVRSYYSPPKLCLSVSLRSERTTKKTGLAQHANHQALKLNRELPFPPQLTPQNDSEKRKKKRERENLTQVTGL